MAILDPAARVSVAALKEIFATTLSDAQLAAFINAATLIVTEELGSSPLSANRLTQIELYLAAHFASTADPRMQSEAVAGEYQYRTQGQTGQKLEATFYGQQVLLLDTSGTLARAAEGLKKATLAAISEYDG